MSVKKAAVVGLGNMGRHHARNYTEIDGCELVAICDHTSDKLDLYSEKFQVNAYSSLSEMFETETIDVVSLVTPTSTHCELGCQILEYGAHLLIEKPIASTLDEADRLIALAKEKKLVLCVGHIERFNPIIVHLHHLMSTGELGDLKSISSKRLSPMPQQIQDMNVLMDLAVHDVDIFSYLIGRSPQYVHSHKGKCFLDQHEDYAAMFLDYGDCYGVIHVSWISPNRQRSLDLQFSKAALSLDYVGQKIIKYTRDSQGDPHEQVIQITPQEPLKRELSHFLSVVKGKDVSVISSENAKEALRLVLQ